MIDQILIGLFALSAIPAAMIWWRRRRKVAAGKRCWNCGNPLMRLRSEDGTFISIKCPRCGDE